MMMLMVHESRRVVHLMIEVLRIRLLEVLVVRHRVEEIVVLLLLLRHWELLLRLLLRCLVRSVSSSSSWSRCVGRRREAQLLHIFFFCGEEEEEEEEEEEARTGKMKKSRRSYLFSAIFCFFSTEEKVVPARYFSGTVEKRENWPQSGNSRHSWLTPPLSYITHKHHLGFVLKSCTPSLYTLSTLTPIDIRRADKSNSRY